MSTNFGLLGHTSNKLPLTLKPIGHKSNSHLLKVNFGLLLAERFCQWICYILYGVYSLHLDELLLKIFAYDVEPPLYVLELLVRPWLLSEGYEVVIVAVQHNDI